MKRTTYCFLTLFVTMYLISSCSQKEEQGGGIAWDCRETNVDDTIDIHSFFPHGRILCLEETEKSRLAVIDKIEFMDSLVFILDGRMARKVFIFNAHNGKFVSSIGSIGHGRGEYYSIEDFALDPVEESVYVLCERDKIIQYDFSGNVRNVMKLGFFAWKMEYSNKRFYFMSDDPGRGYVIVTNEKLDVEKELAINTPETPMLINRHPIQKRLDGTVSYYRYLDNNIYVIDDKNEQEVLYALDYGSNALSLEQVHGMSDDEVTDLERKSRCNLKYYAETDKFAAMLFFDNRKPQISILAKETGIVTTLPYDMVKDPYFGELPGSIEYATDKEFIICIGKEKIKEELVVNKDCNYGENPALYFLNYD